MKRKNKLTICTLLCLLLLAVSAVSAFASGPTDHIKLFAVSADVQEDGTVHFTYAIDWEVLESDGIGPVSWVTVGVPNSYCTDISSASENVEDIFLTDNGGACVEVHFDRDYYEGEVIEFTFQLTQDHLYQVNELTDGETVYHFTPGWFDEIDIDELVIFWNSEKAIAWTPDCLTKDGYLSWVREIPAGNTFSISVTYPNDAYAFDMSRTEYYDGGYYDDYGYNDYGYYDSGASFGEAMGGLLVLICFFIVPFFIIARAFKNYKSGTGFQSTGTTKKIKRTLVKYYPTCQSCGAVREEGQTSCPYCGRSFVESEEVIEEDEVKNPSKYKTEGEYHYGSSPNTYMRVHVVNVPAPRPPRSTPPKSGGHNTRSGGGCVHSSCAHSSCACASHCACACACACAGGGRAGCSTKDFYNTDLKLKQLEKRAKK